MEDEEMEEAEMGLLKRHRRREGERKPRRAENHTQTEGSGAPRRERRDSAGQKWVPSRSEAQAQA